MEVQKPGRGRNKVKPPPLDAQAQNLEALAKEVDRANAIYDDARKNQEWHQKQMTQMLEETISQIKAAHNQVSRVAQDVKGTTGAHTAKFKKGMGLTKDTLKNRLDVAATTLDESITALDGRMTEIEAALEKQRHDRAAHIEATLGQKLQDEATRLQKALAVEQKNRRLQFECEEKLIADEVEAINRLLDSEKFSREQQLMATVQWADGERRQLTKRQEWAQAILARVRSSGGIDPLGGLSPPIVPLAAMGKVHGSLARAGKVKNQTPKVAKAEKKKVLTGRAKKRLVYNRRFVTVVKGGPKRGPNSNQK